MLLGVHMLNSIGTWLTINRTCLICRLSGFVMVLRVGGGGSLAEIIHMFHIIAAVSSQPPQSHIIDTRVHPGAANRTPGTHIDRPLCHVIYRSINMRRHIPKLPRHMPGRQILC